MRLKHRSQGRPAGEIELLQAQLAEAEETLQAIRTGTVDALVVTGPDGDQLYTLAGADEPYRLLVEQMNQGAATLSADGVILYCNQPFADLLQAPLQRVIGSNLQSFVIPGNREDLAALLQARPGCRQTGELTLRTAQGILPLRVAVSGLSGDSTAALCMVATNLAAERSREMALLNMMEDLVDAKKEVETTNRVLGREIFERQEAQEALQKAHFRLRKFVDANIVGVLIADGTGKIKEANDYYLRMIGFSREEFDKGKVNWRDITPPEWLPADEKALEELRETGTCAPYEKEYVRRDGTRVSVFLTDAMLPGTEGEIVAFAVDITKRKHAEAEIRKLNAELEKRVADRTLELSQRMLELETIFKTVPVGLAIAEDTEGRHIRGNPTIERLTGVGKQGELSLTCDQPPPYRARGAGGKELPPSELPMQRACRGEIVTDWIMEIERPNGEVSILQSNATPLHDEDGKPVGAVGAFMDVTKLKRAEAKLTQLSRMLSEGQKIAHLGSFEYIAATQATLWSEEEFRIYGLDPAEPSPAYDVLLAKCIHPDDVTLLHEIFSEAMRTGSIYEYEHRIVRPDGTVRWVYDRAHPFFDADGKLLRYAGVTLDITGRKEVEDALRQSEELRRTVMDNSPDAIYVKDRQSRWLMGNPEVLRIVGKTAQQAMGKTDLELYDDPAIGRAILENDRRIMENGKAETFEEVADTPEGRRTFQSTKAPRRDAQGNIIGLIGISRDITAQKQAEEALHRSEERFKAIASSTPDHLLVQDRDLRYELVVNPQIGLSQHDMIGKTDHDFLTPADADRLTGIKRQVLETGQPIHVEEPLTSRTGEKRYFEGSYIPRFNPQHQVDGLIGYFRDTTDRKRAGEQIRRLNHELQQRAVQLEAANGELAKQIGVRKQAEENLSEKLEELRALNETLAETNQRLDKGQAALEEQRRRYQELFDFAPDGYVVTDLRGRILAVNLAACDLLGQERPFWRQFPFLRCFATKEQRQSALDLLTHFRREQAATTEHFEAEICFGRKPAVPCAVTVNAMADADDRVVGLRWLLHDVTDRRRNEQELHKLNVELQQRAVMLEVANKELESFSYSVSHDLRAPLRAIDGFSRILLEDFNGKLGKEGEEHLLRVRTASQRMGQLIDDLLLLSRATRREMRLGTVDLSRIAMEIVEDLKRANPARLVQFKVQPELTARGDPNLLRVALENLLANAWKFTGKEPAAIIEFLRAEDKAAQAYCVRDNGVGFDPTYASKLFGPFQRLHTPDEFPGTGIGLATVQRIIRRHGGSVWAEGAVGRGAAFYFTLPDERK